MSVRQPIIRAGVWSFIGRARSIPLADHVKPSGALRVCPEKRIVSGELLTARVA